MTKLIDRQFWAAAMWAFIAAIFSSVGLIHAYRLTPGGVDNHFGWMAAPTFAAAYAVVGLLFICLDFWQKSSAKRESATGLVRREGFRHSTRALPGRLRPSV